jgi:hypothetical protein
VTLHGHTPCSPTGRWPAAAPPSRSTRACSTTPSGSSARTTCVTAAREAGHNTHGDGTALDLVPAEPIDQAAWDATAGALARDLGWTEPCGASGVRPACPLVPAIQFVGYDGYPGHGSPRVCRAPPCAARLHISWVSPCYGTSAPSPPCASVTAFASVHAATDR